MTWGVAAGAGRPDPARRFHDDLVGLDPDDPEARAFAEHLDRMERVRPMFTVEGELSGVRDFAESANRSGGATRWLAWLLAVLVLLGAGYVIFSVLEVVATTWLG
ncbi:MAG: hypothetical protein QOE59_3076 [Actinomycetota bacterium]|jgi:hypothetical protein|nr:hypothetical protein [Actinomycetota bacterium]